MSKTIAGLGLAAAVTVVHFPVAQTHVQTQSVQVSTHDDSGLVFNDVAELIAYGTEQLARNLEVHEFGDYKVSQFVASEMVRAANDTNFPVDTLFAIAEKESSFNVNATPPTGTALGLMQFTHQKWLETIVDHGAEFGLSEEVALIKSRPRGNRDEYYVEDKAAEKRILGLRRDPYLSTAMTAKSLLDAKARIEVKLAKEMDDQDLYLPHFLGTNGAANLLAKSNDNPDSLAKALFPKAARANANMFKSGGRALTVREFHNKTRDVIVAKVEKYNSVEEIISANPVPRNAALDKLESLQEALTVALAR